MSQMGETIQTGDNEAREGFASRTWIFHILLSFLYSIVLLLRVHVVHKSRLRSPQKAVIDIVRWIAMHRDQHKVVDCSVGEQSAADNLTPIVNGDGEQGIQVPVGASRKECG